MAFILENQHPQTFYSTKPNLPLIDVGVDPDEYGNQLKAHAFEHLVRPLYTPKSAKKAVRIKDDVSGGTVDPKTFTEALLHFLRTDVIDQDLTQELSDLYKQGAKNPLDSELLFDQMLVLDALAEQQLPYPVTGHVIYTPGEVRDAADQLLTELNKIKPANLDGLRNDWFAKLGAYISQYHLSNFRLITVKDSATFDDLKIQMKQYLKQNITLAPDTARHLGQFDDMSMEDELSVGLFLPYELNDDANGFNRILEYELAKMERAKQPRVFSEVYSLKGLLRPTKILILNLEEYTHGHNLQKEWQQIVRAFNRSHQIRHIKNKNLQSVQAVDRQSNPSPSYDGGSKGQNDPATRSARISYLTKKPISTRELAQRIENIAKKQTTRQVTSNHKKTQKNTFMRANRRKPDDINAQGKVTSTIYSPDLHIWQDTSGSISTQDYERQIQTMIGIAKQLNVDIYFNSFSHMVSETTKIATKNRTNRQIFAMIENIPKVSGGTEFVNVWEAINKTEVANKRRSKAPRIHLIVSDMDYAIPHSYSLLNTNPSVKNTYYVPIRINNKRDRENIRQFAKSIEERGGKGFASGHILF